MEQEEKLEIKPDNASGEKSEKTSDGSLRKVPEKKKTVRRKPAHMDVEQAERAVSERSSSERSSSERSSSGRSSSGRSGSERSEESGYSVRETFPH